MKTQKILHLAAVAATGIAGILHLMIVPNVIGFSPQNTAFFIITGLAQLFWIVPVVKRYGNTWYYTGIGGTAAVIALWIVTRMPNPITGGRALPVNEMGIAVEIAQAAFIGLLAAIVVRARRMKQISKETARGSA